MLDYNTFFLSFCHFQLLFNSTVLTFTTSLYIFSVSQHSNRVTTVCLCEPLPHHLIGKHSPKLKLRRVMYVKIEELYKDKKFCQVSITSANLVYNLSSYSINCEYFPKCKCVKCQLNEVNCNYESSNYAIVLYFTI